MLKFQNKTREKAPAKIPDIAYQKLIRGRKKTNPKFNPPKRVQEKLDPKTIKVVNPANPAGIKLRLDQIKRLPTAFENIVPDSPKVTKGSKS